METLDLEGKRVIDVGCGDGHLVRHMARRGASVLGVECSARQLAKARAGETVGAMDIIEGVGQALPAADASADIVVFFNSLHHVPAEHMETALAEAARVLVPGGTVYVSEPLAEGVFYRTCRPIDDEAEVRALAYRALGACPQLRMEREFTYLHTVVMRDYEAFRERIISANAEREAKFAAMDGEMRALFAANGTPTPDGMEFDQPMRVNLLRRA
ncbi:class I SAM-dependent methyltransferase [Magnetospirillum sp. UT-4]|uniref:class I SAM-dependent methyltransferase n=1 Tax=Magnetospirillum sp. UT-4 TaxID=2681467 RepID=UPI0020C25D00|nr:class I SAM-dependent methyltransferase [Magnetospirillum sp. UT-4]